MRGNRLLLAIVALVFLSLAGFVYLRGPDPQIRIKPETLYSFWKIDLTNTMITSWIVVAVMVVVVFLVTRRMELVPRGVQNLVEAIVEGFFNLVVGIAGEKNGRRFFPVVATMFFFILFANWLSLFPLFNVIGLGVQEEHGYVMEKVDVGPLPVTWTNLSSPQDFPANLKGESISEDDPQAAQKVAQKRKEGKFVGELRPFLRGINTDLNTPLALAIMSAIFVEFWGISTLGLFTYGRKFFNFGGIVRGIRRFSPGHIFQGMVDAFVGALELLSEMVRLISFTFRLFGNMFAGEVVILMFTFLLAFNPLVWFFYGLEIFVGIIQAFIFAALTLAFGMIAVAHAPSVAGEVEGRGPSAQGAGG